MYDSNTYSKVYSTQHDVTTLEGDGMVWNNNKKQYLKNNMALPQNTNSSSIVHQTLHCQKLSFFIRGNLLT